LIAYMKRKYPAPQRRLGVPTGIQPTDPGAVRGALLILMQHGIVSVSFQKRAISTNNATPIVLYKYHPAQARNLMRYAKYIEFMRRGLDETSATVLQTLLLSGRLRTVDWITRVHLPKADHRYTSRQQVVESVHKLVSQGYVHKVPTLEDDDDDPDEEYEFEAEPPTKRVRLQLPPENIYKDEDPTVLNLLDGNVHYKSALPIDAVWKVNCEMFHDQLSAYTFGRLVSERFGSIVQSCGSMVTAALKYRAHLKHVVAPQQGLAFEASSDLVTFEPIDCVKYLPKPVSQQLEKKPGGLKVNIKQAWEEISKLVLQPAVVRRSSDGVRYEIDTRSLVTYLQERAMHQLVYDRHGDVAARVVSILTVKKWLESDNLAEYAMVPAKDTRQVCHLLYRNRYLEMMQLSSSRQHNPVNAIYLWGVNMRRLREKCIDDSAAALLNIRLRRQHQVEDVGRHWLDRERSQQEAEADENSQETDRINQQKFKLGLERLDVAAMQLDETLLLMNDYRTLK
jgi:DNA-directed RNA polymerase III subunit RPC3